MKIVVIPHAPIPVPPREYTITVTQREVDVLCSAVGCFDFVTAEGRGISRPEVTGIHDALSKVAS